MPFQFRMTTVTGGASSIFDPSDKRLLENQKRNWQDLESQIEGLAFIESASVRMSGPQPSPFTRNRPPTVAVVVRVRGTLALDSTQRRGLASVARSHRAPKSAGRSVRVALHEGGKDDRVRGQQPVSIESIFQCLG